MTPDEILTIVAGYFNVTPEDIKQKTRVQETMVMRHIAIYLTTRYTTASLKAIGLVYGKNHATVINSRDTARDAIASNDQLYCVHIDKLKKRIGKKITKVEDNAQVDDVVVKTVKGAYSELKRLNKIINTQQNQILDMEQDLKIAQNTIKRLETRLQKKANEEEYCKIAKREPFKRVKGTYTNKSPWGIASGNV